MVFSKDKILTLKNIAGIERLWCKKSLLRNFWTRTGTEGIGLFVKEIA